MMREENVCLLNSVSPVVDRVMSPSPSSPSPPPGDQEPVSFTTRSPVVDLVDGPWRTYAELERVYRLIYGVEDDVCSLTEASKTLISWTQVARKKNFLPEISAISAFVEAALQDRLHANDVLLQSLYGTAFIRFNESLRSYEFKDSRITRTGRFNTGTSRYKLAEVLGLPSYIVDLRNSAAHGNLLSLDLMRRGTIIAMDWLDQNFWSIVLVEKRNDRRMDGIIEHVFSDMKSVDPAAKHDFNNLMSQSPVSTIKFTVRSLLRATRASDMTMYPVNPKVVTIIAVITDSGQIHVALHQLIDYLDHEEEEMRASAILWLKEVIMGMTTKTSLLSAPLNFFSNPEITKIKLFQIHLLKVLGHLIGYPSEGVLTLIPCFKKIIPSHIHVIDRLHQAMAAFLGMNLNQRKTSKDYQFKTKDDVQLVSTSHNLQNGFSVDERKKKKLKM